MRSIPFLATLVAVPLLLGSTLVDAATSKRTFVASTGSDAHSCSLAQPCRSFAAAIARTARWARLSLDSAGYGWSPSADFADRAVRCLRRRHRVGGDGITVVRLLAPSCCAGFRSTARAVSRVRALVAARCASGCVISNMASNGIVSYAAGLR